MASDQEAQPTVTPNQGKDDDDTEEEEEDLDIEEYNEKTNQLFEGIIKKIEGVAKKVNKIEEALVTNIKSDLSIVKELVLEFCPQKYMRRHVRRKVMCIDKEVDVVVKNFTDRGEKWIEKEEGGNKGKEVDKEDGQSESKEQVGTGKIEENGKGVVKKAGEEVKEGVSEVVVVVDEKSSSNSKKDVKKLMKTSEWLYSIAKKTEKIKKLVSQFGSLDEDGGVSSWAAAKREKQKTVSESTECYKMCIEESLLISPMIDSRLKKSYDHLPPNLRLCLLTLAAFPEDFIIKKRPLIYWWMAEGLVVINTKKSEEEEEEEESSKTAEEVGEENFSQLIQLGLIQPWYEVGNANQPHVQGCRVHPWIRRMLIPVAMEAQLFEFFCIPTPPPEHPHPPPPGNSPAHRSRRVCLYDDGKGVDHTATWKARNRKYDKLRERLKWQINAKKAHHDKEVELSEMPKDLKEVSDRQKKMIISTKFLTDLNNLVADVSHEKIMKHDHDHDALTAVNQSLTNLTTQIDDAMKKMTPQTDVGNNTLINELHDKQMKLQDEIKGLHKQFQVQAQIDYLNRVLDSKWANDLVIYNRRSNCETLQKNEQLLFGHNDLNKQFHFPIMKWTDDADKNTNIPASDDVNMEKLLAIINVNQSYLDMDMKQEWFSKMKNLRILHLGRWRDSFPIPHIELENPLTLEALLRINKHLKYLSLRGISRITELPSTISKCHNLQILDLKACYNLEKLPPQIDLPPKLTHFDVSECYLLQNTNLWTLVQPLQFLQTLKGIKLDQSSQTSLKGLMSSHSLRKLSIILTETGLEIDLSNFHKLRVLSITWRRTETQSTSSSEVNYEATPHPKPQKSHDAAGGANTAETTPPPQPKPEEKISDGDANTAKTPPPPQSKPEAKIDGGGANTAETPPPPQQKPEAKSDVVNGIATLRHLKKLDLRCYPNKDWPNWFKEHSALETLYITGGNLEEFPMTDQDLPKLQVLRFKYLTRLNLGQDINTSKFPSLISYINHNIKSKK